MRICDAMNVVYDRVRLVHLLHAGSFDLPSCQIIRPRMHARDAMVWTGFSAFQPARKVGVVRPGDLAELPVDSVALRTPRTAPSNVTWAPTFVLVQTDLRCHKKPRMTSPLPSRASALGSGTGSDDPTLQPGASGTQELVINIAPGGSVASIPFDPKFMNPIR